MFPVEVSDLLGSFLTKALWREGLYWKRPMQCLASSEILTPHPPPSFPTEALWRRGIICKRSIQCQASSLQRSLGFPGCFSRVFSVFLVWLPSKGLRFLLMVYLLRSPREGFPLKVSASLRCFPSNLKSDVLQCPFPPPVFNFLRFFFPEASQVGLFCLGWLPAMVPDLVIAL